MKVLLYESDPATRSLLVELLRARGHEPRFAGDLEATWDLQQRESCPLLILNWSDGKSESTELCRRVRAQTGGDDVFILALLQPSQVDCPLDILDAGADDFMNDPRHVAGLRARLAVAERHVTLIGERRHAEVVLEHRALHDALTDLPNRVLLLERVQQAIVVARRHSGYLALLMLDLDRFKEVNDTLGHHAGDEVLRQMGQRLQATLRESDTVARLGGDEFAILLPQTDAAGAGLAARKILQAMETPFQVEEQAVPLNSSVGIVLFPAHGDSAEVLLRHADVAMYEAKRAGGGYAIYDASRDVHDPSRLALMGELRQAIEQEQFVLHYLPKVSLQSGRVSGLEALVRWEHPTRGLLPPAEFIPLAEETGLIGALCRWVLNAALRQSQVWRRTGVHLPIEVNLSARNLNDPQFPHAVAQILHAWGAPPASLRLEITERTVGEQLERASHTLGRLRTLGVGIGVDDFGTGTTSPASLELLGLDELKLDSSLVEDMVASDYKAEAVRQAIALGHRLGVPVVAEGVSDAVTRERLTAYGCDQAQGYYLAPPMTAVDLLRWLPGEERRLSAAPE